jgi:uncharacterized protein (DUF2141 family)
MTRFLRYLLTPGFCLLAACATVVAPSGGLRDTSVPVTRKIDPPNYSTGFTRDRFSITFDEYINLKNPEAQVIISPPLSRPPDFRIKQKTLTVLFKEKLKENTTYTINFGSSIADITEGNVLESFQYVFSTGPMLDSLYLQGTAVAAMTQKPDKGVVVMLYRDTTDSVPFRDKPSYFSKTDERGRFRITNVAEGLYRVVALQDLNSNYLYDGSEQIGFRKGLVKPGIGKKDSLRLNYFPGDLKVQRLMKAQLVQKSKILFVFNKPVQGVKIQTKEQAGFFTKEYSRNRDSLYLWHGDIDNDTLTFMLKDTGFADTVKVALKKESKRKPSHRDSILPVETNLAAAMDIDANINFIAERPVENFDSQKILLQEDTVPVNDFIVVAKDSVRRRFSITYPWKEESTYSVTVPKGVFKDVFGLVNDTLKGKFSLKPASSYGSLSMKLVLPDTTSSYIVQLVDEKDNVIQETSISAPRTMEYPYLNPGRYRVKVIYDANENGRWDTGNYLKKIQPEKVVYFHELLSVRANWDMEMDWTLPPHTN